MRPGGAKFFRKMEHSLRVLDTIVDWKTIQFGRERVVELGTCQMVPPKLNKITHVLHRVSDVHCKERLFGALVELFYIIY